MTYPTQDEIVARIKERQPGDPFGFETGEYLRALDFEHAREFLKPDATAESWLEIYTIRSRDDALRTAASYLAFAFNKANACRGISGNRSVQHYVAWAWLAGDREFADQLDASHRHEYAYYGKPQLVMFAEHFGFDWRQYDDDNWTNHEGEKGTTANRALGRSDSAPDFGLPIAQEPKYTVCRTTGRIINRATGNPIPDDEPIMIFRAHDARAKYALRAYADYVINDCGKEQPSAFDRYQAFVEFERAHPDRVRKPDPRGDL